MKRAAPHVRGREIARIAAATRSAVLLVLLLAACARDVERPAVETPAVKTSPPHAPAPASTPAAPIRTDRTSYVLANGAQGPEATIVATLRAPADRTLYILNCNGASGLTLQRRRGDEWVWSWVVGMNACLSPPIVVPPGGEHTSQIYLHERAGAVPGPAGGRLESGTYRVVWTGVLTAFDANKRGFGPELPLEERVSASIAIEVPR